MGKKEGFWSEFLTGFFGALFLAMIIYMSWLATHMYFEMLDGILNINHLTKLEL